MASEVVTVSGTILVAASPEEIWEIVTNPILAPLWNPSVSRVRDFTGMPIRVGSSWVQDVSILGRPTAMTAKVVHSHPPWEAVVQFSGPGEPKVSTRLRSEGGHTRLEQIMEIALSRGLAGIAIRMARPTIKKELDVALRRQKDAVEKGLSGKGTQE